MLKLIIVAALTVLAASAVAQSLELVTSMPLTKARQVVFQDDFAWVAQNMDGAALVDIHNPAQPVLVRQFRPDEMQPLYMQIVNDQSLLVTADRFRGLVIYDVSSPDKPTTVSVLPLERMTTGLDISQTTDGLQMAVLARAGDGLLCVDISDPAAPHITDTFITGIDFMRAVTVADGIVYAADSRTGGLKALRLVSPGRFEPLYETNLAGQCQSLTVDGEKLIVGYYNMGFRIFRLPDPATRSRETSIPLTILSTVLRNRNRVQAIATSGTALIVASAEMGIDLYDASNTALPCLRDEVLFKTPGTMAQSCAVHRNNIYVPAWEAGLLIYRMADSPIPSHFNLENVNYAANNP